MRVHLRNVVHSAIERGLVVGHHRVNKLTKPKETYMDVVVAMMLSQSMQSVMRCCRLTKMRTMMMPSSHWMCYIASIPVGIVVNCKM
mgnify:CR=1 FL=1